MSAQNLSRTNYEEPKDGLFFDTTQTILDAEEVVCETDLSIDDMTQQQKFHMLIICL